MSEAIITVKGQNGKLYLYEDSVFFERKSILGHIDAALTSAKTSYGYEKNISYDVIRGVKLMKASIWRNGYISLVIEGELKNIDGVKDAAKDASSLVFFPGSNEDAEKAATFINKKIIERKSENNKANNISTEKSSLSFAEELEKLYSLKEKRILTEEEFAEAKKKLLSK